MEEQRAKGASKERRQIAKTNDAGNTGKRTRGGHQSNNTEWPPRGIGMGPGERWRESGPRTDRRTGTSKYKGGRQWHQRTIHRTVWHARNQGIGQGARKKRDKKAG